MGFVTSGVLQLTCLVSTLSLHDLALLRSCNLVCKGHKTELEKERRQQHLLEAHAEVGSPQFSLLPTQISLFCPASQCSNPKSSSQDQMGKSKAGAPKAGAKAWPKLLAQPVPKKAGGPPAKRFKLQGEACKCELCGRGAEDWVYTKQTCNIPRNKQAKQADF
eukprot:6492126-Amphidinium_carterae.1